MPNLFKRRTSAASSPSGKGAAANGKSAKSELASHGIRIAANSQSQSDLHSQDQQNHQNSSNDKKVDPSNLLPPESVYRTSLIMPHLTKRFTLLRAPDGTMVTPEAMRAHLRAQRARARATGVPGTQCFLTEEEEDEIIDQLRRQTRMEEMNEWEASVQQQQQQQQEQEQEQDDQQQQQHHRHHPIQFGGTDGFGSWSTPYQSHRRNDSKIDDSIAESFSNLQDPRASNAKQDGQQGATGRLFSSSSSNRDLAYIKEVEKSRAAKRGTDENTIDERFDKDENERKLSPILQDIHDESSDAGRTSRGESLTPIGANRGEFSAQSEHESVEEDAMPGDFLVASHRESRRLSASHSNDNADTLQHESKSFLTPNTIHRPRQHRQSELLTSLTPEAFNRVSMALEEVYEMVSGRVEESEEGGREEEDELEHEMGANTTLLAYESESGFSRDGDGQLSEGRETLEEARPAKRPSFESETNSFTSARSDVAMSALEGHASINRSEALAGIGHAAAAFTDGSMDDRKISPSAPTGWSVSQQGSSNYGPIFDDQRRGKDIRHVAGKSSMGSSSAASVNSQQSNRQQPHSLRMLTESTTSEASQPAARTRNESNSSPQSVGFPQNSNTRLLPAHGTGGIEDTMESPLAAGFRLADSSAEQTESETKSTSAAAAAAAATAAGVAAANYVAQAQQEQRQQRENYDARNSGPMSASDSSATIVPTSEITIVHPQLGSSTHEIQQDGKQSLQQSSQVAYPATVNSVPNVLSPLRPSAAENQVLSANAIAARSPTYFPSATNRSMQSYATGFRNIAPSTSDAVHFSFARSEELDELPSTTDITVRKTGDAIESLNGEVHDLSGQSQVRNKEEMTEPSDKSVIGNVTEISAVQPVTVKNGDKAVKSSKEFSAVQTGALQAPIDLSSLSPLPPSDPNEATKWREQYGISNSADVSSIRSGISMEISEDEPLVDEQLEEQDEIHDDVWARVAKNASPALNSNITNGKSSNITDHTGESREVDFESGTARLMGIGDGYDEKSGLSMDQLQKIQNDLVKSANIKHGTESVSHQSSVKLEKAREKARMISADRRRDSNDTRSNSRNTSLDITGKGNESTTRAGEKNLRPDEVSRKSVGSVGAQSIPKERTSERSVDVENTQQLTAKASSSPSNAPENRKPSNLQRETSSRSFRSQVMYDVTSSHRPTSPPPRTHKTSLSNLPTLQDLSLGVSPLRPAAGKADRNSTSLISMMETSARVHDQLSAGDGQFGGSSISGAIAEEEGGGLEDFEDVAVEDGFGGFTWERRKRLPRSQSHDVLSSGGLYDLEDEGKDAENQPSQFSPKSFRSEPGAEREGETKNVGDASWSRLPGEEPFVSTDLIDDVAAQARAATQALKGQQGERPKMRSKSLGKVRKNLSKAISQPQLVSTTQRMEHTQGLARIDDSLRKRGANQRSPFPQEMRSSSLTPASSPLAKSKTSILHQLTQQEGSPKQSLTTKKIAPSSGITKQGDRALQSESHGTPLETKNMRSESANTIQPRSVSPTDYKTNSPTDYKAQTISARKNSAASGHVRRSSSFGHRGQLDGIGSQSTQLSPTKSGSVTAQSTKSSSTYSPQGEKGQTGLSRLLTRFRGRKASDLPAVIEPYPSDSQSSSAARSSPALGNIITTPKTVSTPAFRTPKESPNHDQSNSNVGKADSLHGPLAMPNQSDHSSLAEMFPSANVVQSPSRKTSQTGQFRATTQESPVTSSHLESGRLSALAPAAPVHARVAPGDTPVNGLRKFPLSRVDSAEMSKRRSARDTIIRRTIIVSTYDPGVDDRRKSVSASRKGSLRRSTAMQLQHQSITNTPISQHHRRTSSTASSKARRSIQDRPPTPPGPEGVSGTHRRKLSQEAKGRPLPPTARNVYEAPTQSPIVFNAGSLNVPQSVSRSNAGSTSRASNVSGYGASLYDLYDRDDDDDDENTTMADIQNRSSGLAPPNDATVRQTSDGKNPGARHIEVTERADGSVVWQVIAGLADRSSVYTSSIGYGGGHSRQNSDTSQYSFMRNPPQHGPFGITSPMGKPNALADEDGRSLFARTPTKKSFSIDENETVPPLPNMNDLTLSSDTATANHQAPETAQELDFEMATTTAGQAATRIVYTSDAELATLLESLAGPDKSSAKFAFQRVYEHEHDHEQKVEMGKDLSSSTGQGNGVESQDAVMASGPSTSMRQKIQSSDQDQSNAGISAASSYGQSSKSGRPVSLWTESELTNDPTGVLRSQRFKIEAEIYSLLQRETALTSSSAPNKSLVESGKSTDLSIQH